MSPKQVFGKNKVKPKTDIQVSELEIYELATVQNADQ